jgi:hypothetical protein
MTPEPLPAAQLHADAFFEKKTTMDRSSFCFELFNNHPLGSVH